MYYLSRSEISIIIELLLYFTINSLLFTLFGRVVAMMLLMVFRSLAVSCQGQVPAQVISFDVYIKHSVVRKSNRQRVWPRGF